MEPALPLPDADGTLTVAEVANRVARALRREFEPRLWVRGEIHGKKRNAAGHVFFDLVGGGCSLPVRLWASDRHAVNRALQRAGNAVAMEDGTEVRIRCEVGWFAKRGEVHLRMLGIDPAFTLGRLAERREVLLRALSAEGLLRAQARLAVPDVPLRVGVVTSLGSAAHGDVLQTLAAAGFGWSVVECDARVQGPGAEAALVAGLRAVVDAGVDVVCLVRGGGARTDLAAFDGEALARAIATAPAPVLTGIGHEVDTSVADEVAWQRHPTPTACAGWLAARVRGWCDRRDAAWARCTRAAVTASERAGRRLDRDSARLASTGRHHVAAAALRVDGLAGRVAAADPARLLARGWTITRTADGRLVRSVDDIAVGDAIMTTVADGEVTSTASGVQEGDRTVPLVHTRRKQVEP